MRGWMVLVFGCAGEKDPGTGPTDTGSPEETGDTGIDPAPVEDLADLVAPALGTGVPAVGAAVLDQERLLALGAAGVRRVGDAQEVQPDDPWHLGSDTKAMTATLAATFVDEGVLAWDATVPELFPALDVDPGWAEVTLEQLLQHRSGMGDAGDHLDWWDAMWSAEDPVAQRAAFAADVFAAPPDYVVGEFLYSNFGYIAVGAALEALAGASWESLMGARIFGPLGMGSCGFGPPGTPGDTDAPWGHAGGAGSYQPMDPGSLLADNPPTLGPAGTVHCSLADWGRFGVAHLAGARGDGGIVSAEAFARMHTPLGDDYAAGWGVWVDPALGGRVLTHDGSNTLWYAKIVVAVDAERVYLVAANAGDEAAVDAVYTVLYDLPGP